MLLVLLSSLLSKTKDDTSFAAVYFLHITYVRCGLYLGLLSLLHTGRHNATFPLLFLLIDLTHSKPWCELVAKAPKVQCSLE